MLMPHWIWGRSFRSALTIPVTSGSGQQEQAHESLRSEAAKELVQASFQYAPEKHWRGRSCAAAKASLNCGLMIRASFPCRFSCNSSLLADGALSKTTLRLYQRLSLSLH